MITEPYGISRATFYRYFHDKYDLTAQYFISRIQSMLQEFYDGKTDFYSVHERMVRIYHQEKEYFRAAMAVTGQNSFEETLKQALIQGTEKAFKWNKGVDSLSPAEQYIIAYANAGVIEVLKQWLIEQDGAQPPEEMIRLIVNFMPQEIKTCLYPAADKIR